MKYLSLLKCLIIPIKKTFQTLSTSYSSNNSNYIYMYFHLFFFPDKKIYMRLRILELLDLSLIARVSNFAPVGIIRSIAHSLKNRRFIKNEQSCNET